MVELLIYGEIDSWSSAEFIRGFAEIGENPLIVRVNSGGGNPVYGLGMINRFREFEGEKTVIVEGQAHSTAGFFMLFAKKVRAIQQAKFIIHRASYGAWYEENYMTDFERNSLTSFNEDMYKAYKAKIDENKFYEVTGVKLKDIFSMDARLEVELNAKQAKQLGLISEIIQLTPEMHKDITARFNSVEMMAKNHVSMVIPEMETPEQVNNKKTSIIMNISELKSQHPALYAEVLQEGVVQGISQERDRSGAWMAFHEIDPKKVKEGIASDKAPSATDLSEFQVSAMKVGFLNTVTEEGKGSGTEEKPALCADTNPPMSEADASEKRIADLSAKMKELN